MTENLLTPVTDEHTEANTKEQTVAETKESNPPMANAVLPNGAVRPNISHIITEDDAAVDNLPSEKHQRLLVEPLYTSTLLPSARSTSTQLVRPFLAAANVGVFGDVHQPPIVPDVFLSLAVEVAEDWWQQEHRSYFIWEFGKAPDVAIEIVSNRRGGETERKMRRYAALRVTYYAVFDPQHLLQEDDLRVYELRGGQYVRCADGQMSQIGLGLTIWEGSYEDKADRWLRWCDAEGNLLPTGAELAQQERQRADRLAAKLRELGVDPDTLLSPPPER